MIEVTYVTYNVKQRKLIKSQVIPKQFFCRDFFKEISRKIKFYTTTISSVWYVLQNSLFFFEAQYSSFP